MVSFSPFYLLWSAEMQDGVLMPPIPCNDIARGRFLKSILYFVSKN